MRKKKKKYIKYIVIIFFEIIIVFSLVIFIRTKGLNRKDSISTSGQTMDNLQENPSKAPENSLVTEGQENQETQEDQQPTAIPTGTEQDKDITPLPQGSDEAAYEEEDAPEDEIDTITISAAGDVTLGRDLVFGWEGTFDHEFELNQKDYGYFFRNVKHIFEADDLTIVNLETTLTTATKMAEKKWRFKADPSYVEILKQGDIEVVSIANNHTKDYLEKGYQDTLATLEEAEVGYFGYEHQYITDIRGIKVGVLGYTYWDKSEKQKKKIADAIKNLREEGAALVIVMYHWGIERDYYPYDVQVDLAHFTVDAGADLVLGSHPHVLQGIEEYHGKQIVYSLGNFCFGGNRNPGDKDSMIYIHRFHFKNGELVLEENEVIPCSISSITERNNYQPTPLEGEEKDRVQKKIEELSDFTP